MDRELQTIEMRIRPVVFGDIYLNVPGGDYLEFNRKMISAVENIGAKYGTVSGSKLKKGIHYIKQRTGCPSTRQIKMMLRNVENASLHTPNDTAYLYRCSIDYYAIIFKFIVETASVVLPDGFAEFSSFLIPKTKAGIEYVENNANDEATRNIATRILNDLI